MRTKPLKDIRIRRGFKLKKCFFPDQNCKMTFFLSKMTFYSAKLNPPAGLPLRLAVRLAASLPVSLSSTAGVTG